MALQQDNQNLYIIDKTKVIGMGSFGQVYECKRQDNKQTRPLCVKIIPKQKNYQNQWKQEIQILNKLKEIESDNLVRVEYIGNHPHQFQIVMEKCDMDLEREFKILKEDEQWYNPAEQIDLLKQIAEGSRILYKNNIVHRDIKPSNILVKIVNKGSENEKRLYQISDFGLGKILDNYCVPGDFTRAGTPLYSSPQILKYQHYSGKCDLYSYGILIYQIFFYGDLPCFSQKIQDVKQFHNQLQKKEFKCQKAIHPKAELIANLIDQMIAYKEEERISFDLFYEHPLLKSSDMPEYPYDSLFSALSKINKTKIQNLSKQQLEQQIQDRLHRIYKIQTILFRKHLFLENIATQLFRFEQITQKFAAYCLHLLGLQQLCYCIGMLHIIISDIHPFFIIDKDVDHLIEILKQSNQNIKIHPQYQELSQRIRKTFLLSGKVQAQYNNQLLKILNENQNKNNNQEIYGIVVQSSSQRINPDRLINFLELHINRNLFREFETQIQEAITLDKKYPIQNFKEIDPNLIIKDQQNQIIG